MFLTRLKVGLVGLFSCLALFLGLFAPTGIVSAHSTQAQHSQASVSVSADDRCRRIVVRRFGFPFNNRFAFVGEDRFRFPVFHNRFGDRFGFIGEDRFRFRVVILCPHRDFSGGFAG